MSVSPHGSPRGETLQAPLFPGPVDGNEACPVENDCTKVDDTVAVKSVANVSPSKLVITNKGMDGACVRPGSPHRETRGEFEIILQAAFRQQLDQIKTCVQDTLRREIVNSSISIGYQTSARSQWKQSPRELATIAPSPRDSCGMSSEVYSGEEDDSAHAPESPVAPPEPKPTPVPLASALHESCTMTERGQVSLNAVQEPAGSEGEVSPYASFRSRSGLSCAKHVTINETADLMSACSGGTRSGQLAGSCFVDREESTNTATDAPTARTTKSSNKSRLTVAGSRPHVLNECAQGPPRRVGILQRRESAARNANDANPLFRFADSIYFEISVILAIFLYTISLGVQADYGTKPFDPEIQSVFKNVEVVFCIVFTLEIVLRIYVQRLGFFYMYDWGWNIFTLGQVLMQIIELLIDTIVSHQNGVPPSEGSGSTPSVLVLRFLRFLRLGRIVRAIRMVSCVQELRTIVVSIIGSLRHVGWTLLVLMMGVYVVAVCITQMVADQYSRCDGVDGDGSCPEDVHTYFGSLGSSTLTLYAAVAGGLDWHVSALELLNSVSPVSCTVLVMYVTFVVFALVNAVTGVFVESALRSAEKAQADILVSLANKIFMSTDKMKAGSIDRVEFLDALKTREMQTYFATIDVGITEAEKVFDIIDIDSSGTIEVEEFVAGVFRLKGPAKALDFVSFLRMWQEAQELLMDEVQQMHETVLRMSEAPLLSGDVSHLSSQLSSSLQGLPNGRAQNGGTRKLMAVTMPSCEELGRSEAGKTRDNSNGPPPTRPTCTFRSA